jgi:hypothetical protein
MTASNGCPYHADGQCWLTPNEVERNQEHAHLSVLSDEWCEAMLEDYGMDYRKWYPKDSRLHTTTLEKT